MEDAKDLSNKQQLFVTALLIEPTIAQAARRAGIDEETAVAWLRQPAVQAEYHLARRERGGDIPEGFQQMVADALAVLRRNLAPTVPRALQVRAAMSVLEMAIRTDPERILGHLAYLERETRSGSLHEETALIAREERGQAFQTQAQFEPERSISPDFDALKPGQLKPVAAEAQALDDQWVPQALLLEMVAKGWSLESPELQEKRSQAILKEYRRALINTEQLVINRAYLYNNRILVADSIAQHPDHKTNREVFKEFLGAGVIVPRFYDEAHPAAKPQFQIFEAGWKAWQALCDEVHMHCLRLSWDDGENADLIEKHFARPFHNFAQHIWTGNLQQYLLALGKEFSEAAGFQQGLFELSKACLQISEEKIKAGREGKDRLVTRSDLYRRFVCVDGSNVAHGVYDGNKPFSREIKQLLDLAYNSYPPDALGIYILTPTDSLPRSALQDFEEPLKQPEVIGEDQLLQVLKGLVFSLVQQGLELPAMEWLTLEQVKHIRETEEWRAYIQSMEHLLANPFDFANPDGGAQRVYRNYIGLARSIRTIAAQHYTRQWQGWYPGVELIINAGAAALIATLTSDGLHYKVMGEILQPVVPVAVRYVVRGLGGVGARAGAQADFATSAVILKRRMKQAREQWEALVRRVGELPGCQRWEGDTQPVQATLGS